MSILFLLDRDGTINQLSGGHITDPDRIELIEGAAQGVRVLNDMGEVRVITNQSIIARGMAKEHDLDQIHARLDRLLAKDKGFIDQYHYCPHRHEDHCGCRKPEIGLFHEIAQRESFRDIWMIGDNKSDIVFGQNIGAKTILVETGYGLSHKKFCQPDYIFKNLLSSAYFLKHHLKQPH